MTKAQLESLIKELENMRSVDNPRIDRLINEMAEALDIITNLTNHRRRSSIIMHRKDMDSAIAFLDKNLREVK